MKSKLICMAFDGAFQTERPVFADVAAAWCYANNLGSKWFFYPFYFVTTASGRTVRGAGYGLERFEGMRVAAVAKQFARIAALPEAKNAGVDEFIMLLNAA